MQKPYPPTPTTEQDIDEAVMESFPASDPPSFMSTSTASPTKETIDSAQRASEPATTTEIFRIVGENQAEKPFGSNTRGQGRWTSEGTPAVYASASAAAALLEFLAHCDAGPPATALLARARIPRDRVSELDACPPQWRDRPYRPDVQRLGDEWSTSHRSLALRVPSALCDGAYNVLINPDHVDAPLIQGVDVQRIEIDDRLRRVAGD